MWLRARIPLQPVKCTVFGSDTHTGCLFDLFPARAWRSFHSANRTYHLAKGDYFLESTKIGFGETCGDFNGK